MMRRVRERPRMSTPYWVQEKGCWKMRWPRSPAKNRASVPVPARAARRRSWADIRDPLGGNAVAEQVGFREVGERPLGLRSGRCFLGDVKRNLNLANRFADLNDLGGAGDGMGFDLAPRSPVVGGIVVGHVAEHHAALDPMEDQPDVTAGAGRPEVLVLDVVEPVALQTRVGGIDLQLEGCELGSFLLFSTELLKAGLEAVGEEESHEIVVQEPDEAMVMPWSLATASRRLRSSSAASDSSAAQWIAALARS